MAKLGLESFSELLARCQQPDQSIRFSTQPTSEASSSKHTSIRDIISAPPKQPIGRRKIQHFLDGF